MNFIILSFKVKYQNMAKNKCLKMKNVISQGGNKIWYYCCMQTTKPLAQKEVENPKITLHPITSFKIFLWANWMIVEWYVDFVIRWTSKLLKNLKTPFFSRYSKFLPMGNWNRSRTSPKFFSKKNSNKYGR